MAEVFIEATGDDTTGDGSRGNPYATIAKAHTVIASSGDTIVCLGDFAMVSQVFTKQLTVRGDSWDAPGVFDGGGAMRRWNFQADFTLQDLEFQDIDMNGNTTYDDSAPITVFIPSVVYNAGEWNIVRCKMHDIVLANDGGIDPSGLVSVLYAADSVLNVIGTLMYDISRLDTGNIAFITNNNDSLEVNLYNNTLVCNVTGSDKPKNIVHSGFSSITGVWKNNIFYTTEAIALQEGSTPDVYENNCAYGFTAVPSGSNNITSDPLFIDMVNGIFELAPNSPCLDMGTII